MSGVDIEELEPPLGGDLAAAFIELWEEAFGMDCAYFQGVFRGEERDHNRDLFFMNRRDGVLAGTCHVTLSRSQPQVGGFGEVVTTPQFRRQGIAGALCGRARDVFLEVGGEALFLGTGNAEALRVYHRLGWRKLAGCNVMALVNRSASPEVFLADYFRRGEAVRIEEGTAAARVPMIPLIVCPHDWRVLDANTQLFSTRYVVQSSCMGLYPRYEKLVEEGGIFFEVRTGEACLVGLATAKLDGAETCQVDGFVHGAYADAWEELMEAVLEWGGERGVIRWRARVAVEDEDKRARFEGLGFSAAGAGEGFVLQERAVASTWMEKAAGVRTG